MGRSPRLVQGQATHVLMSCPQAIAGKSNGDDPEALPQQEKPSSFYFS